MRFLSQYNITEEFHISLRLRGSLPNFALTMRHLICFVCSFVKGRVYRPTREFFTHMETSPLPMKGCKFWPMLCTHQLFITETFMNEIFNFQGILTHVFEKKIGQILFGVEMDRRRRGYTSSGESGMKRSLLRYLFFAFLVT